MKRSFGRAVIVGGSGGIGSALAAALLDDGTEVHSLSRSCPSTGPCLGGHIDLTDETTIARAAADMKSRGEPDLVIVASGFLQNGSITPEKTYRQLASANLQQYFAVNATGPALVAKHFLPLLPDRKRAAFVALSARVGSIGDNRSGGWYGYRASKAALNMLVKTLAIEQARRRPEALCVALHPGTVDTPLSKPFQRNVQPEKLFSPELAARQLLRVLAGLGPADSGGCFAWDGSRIDP